MKKDLRKSILQKVTVKYLLFIVIPTFLLMAAFFQLLVGEFNAEIKHKNELITQSVENSVNSKIKLIENIGANIALNGQLVNFLQSREFLEYNFFLTDYREKIIPIVQYALLYPGINILKIVVFYNSPNLPEGFGIFFHDKHLKKFKWAEDFISNDKEDSMWIYLHDSDLLLYNSLVYSPGGGTSHPSMLYIKKIKNSKGKYLGLVALQVDIEEFFKDLNQSKDSFSFFVTDKNLNIIWSNTYIDKNLLPVNNVPETRDRVIETNNNLISYRNIHAFNNIYLFIMFRNEVKYKHLKFFLLIAIGLSSFLTVTLYYTYIRQIFFRLHKNIEKINFSISQGFLPLIETWQGDEIDEICEKFNILIDKIQSLTAESLKREIAHKDAQIRALQYQLNPHFIYNTLTLFASRLELDRHYEMAEAISEFSKLLRYNLKSNSLYTTLEEEIRYINSFLAIQKVKYSERIQHVIEVPDILLKISIPRFILPPLVENCIHHGIDDNIDPLIIKLNANISFSWLIIQIEDNGKGFSQNDFMRIAHKLQKKDDPCERAHFGIGIINIYERLKLFYGNNFKIIIESTEKKGTKVVLQLPYTQSK